MPTGSHLSPTGQTIRQQVAQLDEGSRRDKTWLGDAVLSLFARQWLLGPPQDWQVPSPPSCDLNRAELFTWLTSNQFLSAFRDPTQVEAEIGLSRAALCYAACSGRVVNRSKNPTVSRLDAASIGFVVVVCNGT